MLYECFVRNIAQHIYRICNIICRAFKEIHFLIGQKTTCIVNKEDPLVKGGYTLKHILLFYFLVNEWFYFCNALVILFVLQSAILTTEYRSIKLYVQRLFNVGDNKVCPDFLRSRINKYLHVWVGQFNCFEE
jgi:hypothetical protein